MEIIERIRTVYKNAKTAVIFHDSADTVKRILGDDAENRLNQIDVLGYRSLSIQRSIEGAYRLSNRRFICYSRITSSFLDRECPPRKWDDGPVRNFLFVGRMVYYKHPQAIAEALYEVYPQKDFSLRYRGKEDTASKSTSDYVHNKELDDSISFLGQIDREKIISWIYVQQRRFRKVLLSLSFSKIYLKDVEIYSA